MIDINRYDIILLDADDTLFNFAACEAFALKTVFTDYGLKWSDDHHKKYAAINIPLWQALERGEITQPELVVKRFAILADKIGLAMDPAQFNSDYLDKLGQAAFLCDGAEALCRELKNRGKHLYVVTNGVPKAQRARFAVSSIGCFFNDIFVSGEIGVAKPHQGYFEYVLARLPHNDKTKMLIIGDSLSSDIAGGNAAGIDTVWYNPCEKVLRTNIIPTYEIKHLLEIVE